MYSFNEYLEKQANLLVKKAEKLEKRSSHRPIYWATVFSVYGCQVAFPALLGIFIGRLLDKHFPSTYISWTLNLILLGFVIGIYNATAWFYHMLGLRKKKATNRGRKKQ